MRILQVVHQYPPRKVGGTEIYTQNLAGALRARGHHVAVFHRGAPSARRSVETSTDSHGVRVFTYRENESRGSFALFLRSFRNPALESSFEHLLLGEQPEVVHFQHLKDLDPALVSLTQRRGIPTVLSLHDYWFMCPNAQLVHWKDGRACEGPRFWLNCAYLCAAPRVGISPLLFPGPAVALLFAYRHRLLSNALLIPDLVVCPSEFVRSMFVKRGLPGAKAITSENGIELSEDPMLRRKEQKQGMQFVYLGSIAWQKGVHVLVEAFNRLGAVRAGLTICGDESDFPEYARSLREAATSSITFRGAIGRSDVWTALGNADALVVPSLWYEVSPLVVQEAFAAGVPVIASRIGALEEKVRHGIDGLLFPAGDAGALSDLLRALLVKPSILEDLKRSRPAVKTVRQSAEEIEALYRTLLPSRRPSDGDG